MPEKPYVGVTGKPTQDVIWTCLEAFSAAGINMGSNHIPMIGFVFSDKTLYNIPSSDGKVRYQQKEKLRSGLEIIGGQALSMIHYYTDEETQRRYDLPDLPKQIKEIFEGMKLYEHGICRALQLNRAWPKVEDLNRVISDFPELKIVLQLPKRTLETSPKKKTSPRKIAKKLKEYEGLIKYALIDLSGGKGIDFDLNHSVKVYQECRSLCPETILGFAGCLSEENLEERVNALKTEIGNPDWCIDVESGIKATFELENGKTKKKVKHYADDINPTRVWNYIQKAGKLFL